MFITPVFLAAIALAALGAVLLAAGTHLQHRAVRTDGAAGERGAARLAVLTRPVWLLGTALVVAETVLNVIALGLAPVALVQPVGALSLVVAVLISARALRIPVTRALLGAVALTIGSVGVFVGTSARFSLAPLMTEAAASELAVLLLCGSVAAFVLARSRAGHLARVAGAGVLFGGVASGAHVIAAQAFSHDGPSPHTVTELSPALLSPSAWALAAVLVPASAAGMWLVQTAHASGPPETVLAGLTVVDPLTAVGVGAILLGEYAPIPPGTLALLLTSAVAAFAGIALLVRHHPSAVGARAGGRDVPDFPEPVLQTVIEPDLVRTGRADTHGVGAQNRRS